MPEMNIENVRERLSVAQEELKKLEQKKLTIEAKIKAKQEQIDGYALQISQYEMAELTKSLNESGTTLAEVLQAIRRGDLSNIQSKIGDSKVV